MIVINSDGKPTRYSGLLISFEGGDGTGKTTALTLVYERLKSEGYDVMWTDWDGSKLAGKALKKGKRKQRMTPLTYTLLSACNIADRLQKTVLPFLRKGGIVCADRWFYTSLARDVARGNDPKWVRQCYQWCPDADVVAYFKCDPAVALQRKIEFDGEEPKYYECGLDKYPELESDPHAAFIKFQGDINREYERMAKTGEIPSVIDANRSMEEVEVDAQALIDVALKKIRKAA